MKKLEPRHKILEFTVRVVHWREGNGNFQITKGNRVIARDIWDKEPAIYEMKKISSILDSVKKLLEDLKF